MAQTIYLNMDKKLRVGGRKAPSISVEKFLDILQTKIGIDDLDDEYAICSVFEFIYDDDTMYRDIFKIEVEAENYGKADEFYGTDSIEYVHNNLPVLVTSTGIPFLVCSIGGDWEIPVVIMIYWDGKKLRGYLPTKGNPYNTKAKAAFGNNDKSDVDDYKDSDEYYIKTNGGPEYSDDKKLFFNIAANIPACIEDFTSRVEVI